MSVKKKWWRFHTKMRERANNVTRPIYQSLPTMGLNGCRLTFDGDWKRDSFGKCLHLNDFHNNTKIFCNMVSVLNTQNALETTVWLNLVPSEKNQIAAFLREKVLAMIIAYQDVPKSIRYQKIHFWHLEHKKMSFYRKIFSSKILCANP